MKAKEFSNEEYIVYGIFGVDDKLLYIGYTNDLNRRIKEHNHFSSNKLIRDLLNRFIDIKYKIIAIFYDSELAKEYEKILINKHFYNVLNISMR